LVHRDGWWLAKDWLLLLLHLHAIHDLGHNAYWLGGNYEDESTDSIL